MSLRVPLVLLVLNAACTRDPGTYREPGTTTPSLARQRLDDGARALDSILRGHPTDSVRALVSFAEETDIDEAVSNANRAGLTIAGFRHGSRTHSGGYTLSPGEALDAAIAAYRRDLELLPRLRATRLRQLAAESADPELSRVMSEHAAELEARVQALTASARVRIIGLEVSGPATSLDEFRRTVAFVRGVELQDGTRRTAAVPPFAH